MNIRKKLLVLSCLSIISSIVPYVLFSGDLTISNETNITINYNTVQNNNQNPQNTNSNSSSNSSSKSNKNSQTIQGCTGDSDYIKEYDIIQKVRQNDNNALICYLEHNTAKDVKDNNGNTLVHLVVKYGNIDGLEYLNEAKYPLDTVNAYSETPFLIAVKNNNYNIAVKLLEFTNGKINLDATDTNKGYSAIFYAVEHKNTQILNLLLGIDEQIKTNSNIVYDKATISKQSRGETPLIKAVKEDFAEGVKLLSQLCNNQNEACIDTVDFKGRSALFYVKSVKVTQILMSQYINPDTPDKDNLTADQYIKNKSISKQITDYRNDFYSSE